MDLRDRKCIYCNSGHVEDENHFIFHCKHYDHLRGHFLEKVSQSVENFELLDEIEKFRFVLSDEKIQTETATFVQEAFLFRKNTKL